MNLCEYQEMARSTAIYLETEGSKMIYPALGLAGECGEVVEKIKKFIRDDGEIMTQERRDGIKKELGDVMWYCANICCDADLDLDMVYKMRTSHSMAKMHNITLPQLALSINRQACIITNDLELWYYKYDCSKSESCRFKNIPQNLTLLIVGVEEMANQCDSTLEEVCSMNISKLLDRKERGRLKGSGDNR